MNVEPGKLYRDGHGDVHGPMELRAGMWLDQHGGIYLDNGFQWNHVAGSAGNLIEEVPSGVELPR